MDKVRIGLIGCGVIGRSHMRAAATCDRVEVVAVADLLPERARAYAEEFGVATTYASGDELIDQAAVDAVILALPACGRFSLGLHAFAAGKHLLTEKPVAMDAGQVEQLIAARGKLVGACCSGRFRFTPSARAVAECLAAGRLGDLRVIRVRHLVGAGKPPAADPPEWRLKKHLNGGGILMNWGCYDLDYLLGQTGWTLRPETVLAQTWSVSEQFRDYVAPGSEAETHVTALVRCAGGPVIHYERGEFCSTPSEAAWAFIGSRGAIHLSLLPGKDKRVELHEGLAGPGVVATTLFEGDDPNEQMSNGLMADFAGAILDGHEAWTSLDRALRVQRLTDAIYRSAASGEAEPVA